MILEGVGKVIAEKLDLYFSQHCNNSAPPNINNNFNTNSTPHIIQNSIANKSDLYFSQQYLSNNPSPPNINTNLTPQAIQNNSNPQPIVTFKDTTNVNINTSSNTNTNTSTNNKHESIKHEIIVLDDDDADDSGGGLLVHPRPTENSVRRANVCQTKSISCF